MVNHIYEKSHINTNKTINECRLNEWNKIRAER